jgi:hypothetical protein
MECLVQKRDGTYELRDDIPGPYCSEQDPATEHSDYCNMCGTCLVCAFEDSCYPHTNEDHSWIIPISDIRNPHCTIKEENHE